MAIPYDENGFLHGRIEHWVKEHRETFSGVFAEAEALNRRCHEFLDGRSVALDNERQLLTSVLFARILELYQGAILLAERGLSTSVRIQFRAFLEAFFHHAAIHIDPGYLDDYLNQFHIQRQKFVNRIRQTSSSRLKDLRQKLDEVIVAKIAKIVKDEGAQRISIEDVARRAQLHDIYVTVYEVLSRAVHTSATDLESPLQLSKNSDEIVGFLYGPSSNETRRVICLMGMALSEALEQVSRTFGEDRNKLCSRHKEGFQALLREVDEENSI